MEATFTGIMTLNSLIKVIYNDPDIGTYSGFEVHLPGDNLIVVCSDFPPYDYISALRLSFDNGYYPLLDRSVSKFVEDGGIISFDGEL